MATKRPAAPRKKTVRPRKASKIGRPVTAEDEAGLQEQLLEGRWRHPASRQTPGRPPTTRLAPGGILSPFQTGHYEVTQEAAQRFGFSSPAIAILRDAAQDPDFYEWGHPWAHAQTPDAVGAMKLGPDRDAAIAGAIKRFQSWARDRFIAAQAHLHKGNPRPALYWVGYLLHGVEDLAPHQGRTNAEHSWNKENPDEDERHVELARHYAYRTLRALRDGFGAGRFDLLRAWSGDGTLSRAEKRTLHGHGWDFGPKEIYAYKRLASTYSAAKQPPVRWPRELVLGPILDDIASRGPKKKASPKAAAKAAANGRDANFEPLSAAPQTGAKAKWTVMVYMAGDDQNKNGIEYAVREDLAELKLVGSSDRVHLLAQTDEVRDRNSYRFRLRKGTSVESDRLQIYRGDLNTGKVGTLVDFVKWAKQSFPAERYALVFWGHGSGHDDQDVYRLVRGRVSPRLAMQLSRRRLGFFGSTRRSVLEKSGPSRGFCFDDSAADFLDNIELRRAIEEVRAILGQPLDLLGFDACLMAMIEVAHQVHGLVDVMVSSQRTEPGDGWPYAQALAALGADGEVDPERLAGDVVTAYAKNYGTGQTLSAIRVSQVPRLVEELARVSAGLKPAAFDRARRVSLDVSPRSGLGYRDLGAFLEALGKQGQGARKALKSTVITAAGGASGLSVYVPSDYDPNEPGGTDELYERLDFATEARWAELLRRMYAQPPLPPARTPVLPALPPTVIHALDRHNAHEILTHAVSPDTMRWHDALRRDTLHTLDRGLVAAALDGLGRPTPDLRIFVVPGIMGSTLNDRTGHNSLVWVDPIGLAVGRDFEAMQISPDGLRDADPAVRIEPVSPIPVIYDRLAAALLAVYGPVTENVAYDWRRSIASAGELLTSRLRQYLEADGARRAVLVCHSMGGLVAAAALDSLGGLGSQVLGTIAMGTPWEGSYEAALNLRGEGGNIRTFAQLTRWKVREVTDICQSFWGLSDLLPNEPALLDPALYAPGPLSSSHFADRQLGSARDLRRTPPTNTVAIVCERKKTVVRLAVSGGRVTPEHGPGDGTVPAWSATARGALPTVQVNQSHSTLPLDSAALRATVDQIDRWLGMKSPRGSALPLDNTPPLASTRSRTSRSAFLKKLDTPEGGNFELNHYLALLPLL